MQNIRQKIDDIDNEILNLFAKRFSLVKEIGEIKKQKNATIKDVQREEEKLNSLIKNTQGIPEAFIRDIWQRIFSESYRLENLT